MVLPVCLWGHALQEMRESTIGAELLSGRVPDGKLRVFCPFNVPQLMGNAIKLRKSLAT